MVVWGCCLLDEEESGGNGNGSGSGSGRGQEDGCGGGGGVLMVVMTMQRHPVGHASFLVLPVFLCFPCCVVTVLYSGRWLMDITGSSFSGLGRGV